MRRHLASAGWFVAAFGFLFGAFYLEDVGHPIWGLVCIAPALMCAEMGRYS